jgi:hypothetical protein
MFNFSITKTLKISGEQFLFHSSRKGLLRLVWGPTLVFKGRLNGEDEKLSKVYCIIIF